MSFTVQEGQKGSSLHS